MTIETRVPRIVATGFVLLWVISGAVAQGLAESSGAVLGRLGWEAIRPGQISEASRLFHDAIADNARDATLFLRARLAAHLQGQEMEARTALQEAVRSEEHTSELQSRLHLVCRLLLEKKNSAAKIKIFTATAL